MLLGLPRRTPRSSRELEKVFSLLLMRARRGDFATGFLRARAGKIKAASVEQAAEEGGVDGEAGVRSRGVADATVNGEARGQQLSGGGFDLAEQLSREDAS